MYQKITSCCIHIIMSDSITKTNEIFKVPGPFWSLSSLYEWVQIQRSVGTKATESDLLWLSGKIQVLGLWKQLGSPALQLRLRLLKGRTPQRGWKRSSIFEESHTSISSESISWVEEKMLEWSRVSFLFHFDLRQALQYVSPYWYLKRSCISELKHFKPEVRW